MKNFVLILLLAFITLSCSGVSSQTRQEDEIAVLERAEEFIGALYHKDFGKWWDLMIPAARNVDVSGASSREEFANLVKGASEHTKVSDYDSAKIVVIGDKYAVTQAEVDYEIEENGSIVKMKDCEKTIWLKSSGEWYWQKTGLDCNYTPSTEQLKSLTRDLR